MPEFSFSEIFPLGPDTTEYRLIGTDGVSEVTTPLGTFLKVEPEAITLLTQTAMRDIAHLLRTDHLKQLKKILDDPEASANDKFVALDLLKNASIAAGGVLPMCQDTGTAIVKGKKGQFVMTGGGALLRNLDKVIAAATRVPVFVAENPLNCVVLGTGRALEEMEALRTVLVNAY